VEFNVDSMGRTALSSLASGKKQSQKAAAASSTPLSYFLPQRPTSVSVTPGLSGHSSTSTPSSATGSTVPVPSENDPSVILNVEAAIPASSKPIESLDKYRMKDDVTEAETLWCLHNVMSRASLRTSAMAVTLFPLMFPDRNIGNSMSLQDKISYSVTYGLSPYIQKLLEGSLQSAEFVVIGYDESLNSLPKSSKWTSVSVCGTSKQAL